MTTYYGFLGKSGMEFVGPEDPEYADAKIAFRRNLMWLAGTSKLSEECDHPRKSFNGYVWRCHECGSKLK
jgi:hypothetical protein